MSAPAGQRDESGRECPRVDLKRGLPESYRALAALTRSAGVLGDGLDELVKVRASILNGCTFCIDAHVERAVADGEDARRLHALPAWRDSGFFTDRERAALALTDALTELPGTPDVHRSLDEASAHFGSEELHRLVVAIVAISAWNRSAIAGGLAPDPLTTA